MLKKNSFATCRTLLLLYINHSYSQYYYVFLRYSDNSRKALLLQNVFHHFTVTKLTMKHCSTQNVTQQIIQILIIGYLYLQIFLWTQNHYKTFIYSWKKGYWIPAITQVRDSVFGGMYPHSPICHNPTRPSGLITKCVILPLWRLNLSHASGGTCSAL